MSLVIVLLVARGADDWSDSFATIWYGLWIAALALAIAGVGSAVVTRGVPLHQRLITAGIACVTLVASGLLVMTIIAVLSTVS